MENFSRGFNNRIDQVEERISEFEDKSLEITKSGTKRKKNDKECRRPKRLMGHE